MHFYFGLGRTVGKTKNYRAFLEMVDEVESEYDKANGALLNVFCAHDQCLAAATRHIEAPDGAFVFVCGDHP